ncbi:MAG: hypothetical protein QNK59_01020 [Flavobacteriales bacterium]
MKRIAIISVVFIALALSSCGSRRDCDCPSFSSIDQNESTSQG